MQGAAGVFGSATLEVAIGIIFLYFVLSVICSSVTELVAALMQWRAKDLEYAVVDLFGKQSSVLGAVAAHPLIAAMGHNNRGTPQADQPLLAGRPAYIHAKTFSQALLDAIVNPLGTEDRVSTSVSELNTKLKALPDQDRQRIGRALQTLIQDSRDPHALAAHVDSLKAAITSLPRAAGEEEQLRIMKVALAPIKSIDDIEAVCRQHLAVGSPEQAAALKYCDQARQDLENVAYNIDKVQKNVEVWFDNAMDRMSGVYKRNIQKFLLLVGVVVTLCTGADTFHIATTLFANPTLRTQLVTTAQTQVQPPPAAAGGGASAQSPTLTQSANLLAPYSLLFGYSDIPDFTTNQNDPTKPTEQRVAFVFWLEKIVGLGATTFAILMGGPFWFQLLQKLVNVRSTGPKPKRADEQNGPSSTGT